MLYKVYVVYVKILQKIINILLRLYFLKPLNQGYRIDNLELVLSYKQKIPFQQILKREIKINHPKPI